MWQSVKVASPDLSVCEVGAKIGRLWRELTAEQKDKYNEEFNRDKVIWCLIISDIHLIYYVNLKTTCR